MAVESNNFKKTKNNNAEHTGIMIKLKSYLERNRIGELMVMKGHISANELRDALNLQKQYRRPLGEILVEFNYITSFQLQKTLWRQRALRTVTGLMLCMVSMTALSSKKARADYIPDVPAKIAISASAHFSAVASYPALFGSEEKESSNLKPFTKWTEMFERFDREIKTSAGQSDIEQWQNSIRKYEGLPLKKMAEKVNSFVNETRYITDQRNYGKSDYWATPVEFIRKGGDCEDFAIVKYTALRALGVPENRMRIAIVHDNIKNIPHAILIVYTDQGAYVLDNQEKKMINSDGYNRYRPIFSINRQAWWLHTAPQATVLASAE